MSFFEQFRTACVLGLATAGVLGCSGEDKPPPLPPASEGGPLTPGLDPRLIGTPCPMAMPWAGTECGRLSVPESRSGQSERMLSLPVVIFRSPSPFASKREPVVYLEGGPGGHAIQGVVAGFRVFEGLIAKRDLIVFDQRGTGYGSPRLDCPELGASVGTDLGSAATLLEQQQAQLSTCRTQLSGIARLDDYNSLENAADVDDLRVALGYAKWHLLGVSYGTRLALEVLRQHPESISSVILDSVLPPQVDFVASGTLNFKRAMDAVFARCLLQSDCALAYPNLEARFYDTLTSLEREPQNLALRDGTALKITSNLMARLLFNFSYDPNAVSYFPELLYGFSEGDFSILDGISFSEPEPTEGDIPSFSYGMYLSVVCRDYVPFSSVQAAKLGNEAVKPALVAALGSENIFSLCETWNVQPAKAEEHAPVVSDLPVLLLSGFHDPVTPPAWASQAAESLSHGLMLTFNGDSHGIISNPCAPALMNAYWNSPSSDPSANCPNRERALVFEVLATRLPPAGTTLPGAGTGPRRGGRSTAEQERMAEILNHALAERRRLP